VDLAHALVRVLLKRRNRRDFAPEANGLANVAWLLNNTPDELAHLTTPFLKAVCSRDWLSQQYMHWKTTCGSIATGLRRLAMHQPPKVWRHFICRELGLRLETELAAFAERTPELQLETLRLLGAAELTEWHADSRWLFLNVPAEAVVDLATNVVEYDEDAVKLSDAEIEFWLGMRALVLATDWRLRVPKDTIKHTLDLCRLNLAASPSRPCSTEHATYAEMVCWLEQCLTERPPAVIPPRPSEMAAEFSRRRK